MDQHAHDDVGGRLQAARHARGQSLREIAATTKISPRNLAAIERNEFETLPGGLFRRGYVRAFASAVGLDADELAGVYRARFEHEDAPEPAPLKRADFDNRPLVERGAKVGATVIVAAAAWMMWQPAPPPPADPWLEASGPRAVLTGLPASLPSRLERGGNDEVAFAVSVEEQPALQLEIHATAACWLAADADGERVIYRLVEAGEQILIEAHGSIDLRIGDAGAVTYSINGEPGRPLGAPGEAVTARVTADTIDRFIDESASVT
jgi:cytoskeletal protein RodZ